VNFDHPEKVRALLERLEAFMDEHVYPNEGTFREQLGEATARGERWSVPPIMEELKEKGEGRGALEPVSAGLRARGGAHQPGVRAPLRGHG